MHASWRDVCLTGEAGPAQSGARDDTCGDSSGTDVFLIDDGTLALVSYTGSWSRWLGEGSEWTATIEPLTLERFIAGWTAAEPERVADLLADRLQAVISGKAVTRAAASRERAKRLLAVSALLR